MKQDVGELQTWVQNYYQEIHSLPSQDTKEFKDFLDDENSLHKGEFNTMAAVEMLWSYVKQVINITIEFNSRLGDFMPLEAHFGHLFSRRHTLPIQMKLLGIIDRYLLNI